YNHNLNTAESNYADICTTHSYQDRADTVTKAKAAGLSPCSGLIAGMGETDDELMDVVFALRELDPDSVPVNFLIPFEGTPLGGQWALTPQRCLRILAMVRFTCPDAEVRLAGGRPGAPDPEGRPAPPAKGPVPRPGRRGPAGRRPGDPPAQPAAARAAHRQLDLPRRLPDQRGPGRRPRPGDDRRRRLHRRGRGRAHPAGAPARPGPGASPRPRDHAPGGDLIRGSRTSSAPPRCTGRRRRPSRWGSGGSARRPGFPARAHPAPPGGGPAPWRTRAG